MRAQARSSAPWKIASNVAPYANMVEENNLRWTTLDEVTAAVSAFLDPVLRGDEGGWDPSSFTWRRDA